jgi:hypothetical protein
MAFGECVLIPGASAYEFSPRQVEDDRATVAICNQDLRRQAIGSGVRSIFPFPLIEGLVALVVALR